MIALVDVDSAARIINTATTAREIHDAADRITKAHRHAVLSPDELDRLGVVFARRCVELWPGQCSATYRARA